MRKSKSKKKAPPKGRERRLALAPDWVATYTGKPNNIVKRYRAIFHVDWECAIAELTELGIAIDDKYLSSLRQTIFKEFKKMKILHILQAIHRVELLMELHGMSGMN